VDGVGHTDMVRAFEEKGLNPLKKIPTYNDLHANTNDGMLYRTNKKDAQVYVADEAIEAVTHNFILKTVKAGKPIPSLVDFKSSKEGGIKKKHYLTASNPIVAATHKKLKEKLKKCTVDELQLMPVPLHGYRVRVPIGGPSTVQRMLFVLTFFSCCFCHSFLPPSRLVWVAAPPVIM